MYKITLQSIAPCTSELHLAPATFSYSSSLPSNPLLEFSLCPFLSSLTHLITSHLTSLQFPGFAIMVPLCICLLATHSLPFPLFENILILPSFQGTTFTGYKTLCSQLSFSSLKKKMLFHCHLAFMVSDEKSTVNLNSCSLLQHVVFL